MSFLCRLSIQSLIWDRKGGIENVGGGVALGRSQGHSVRVPMSPGGGQEVSYRT